MSDLDLDLEKPVIMSIFVRLLKHQKEKKNIAHPASYFKVTASIITHD